MTTVDDRGHCRQIHLPAEIVLTEAQTILPIPLYTEKYSLMKLEYIYDQIFTAYYFKTWDRRCDLVVRVSGYSSRGPSSIPDATRFSEN
jgi:hypothetical protein